MNKDKSLIPPGIYCYMPDLTYIGERKFGEMPIVSCPYSTYKEIAGVKVPWCSYLNKGGLENDKWSDKEWLALEKHFGDRNKMYRELPLDLLWDDCKECHTTDADYEEQTQEECLAWINKIKSLKKEEYG